MTKMKKSACKSALSSLMSLSATVKEATSVTHRLKSTTDDEGKYVCLSCSLVRTTPSYILSSGALTETEPSPISMSTVSQA